MRSSVLRLFKAETPFGAIFMLIGCLVQIITILVMGETIIALVSGIAGIVSVVQCSERKLSFYFWGLLQIATFSIICIQEQLYGKLFENAFYVCTMIWGILVWGKNKEGKLVNSRKLGLSLWSEVAVQWMLGTVVMIKVLYIFGGTSPILDGVTTTTAIVAQLLMVLRYREQWIFWLAVDILCVILFLRVENYCMVLQYMFWTANCVYGYLKWSR